MIRLSRRTTIKIRPFFVTHQFVSCWSGNFRFFFLGFVFLHTRCWTGLVSTGQITTAALALQQSPLWHSIIKAQLFTTSSSCAGYLPIYYTVNLCRCTRIIGLISRAVAWFFGYTHQKTLSPIIYGFTYGGLSQEPRSLLLLFWGLGRSSSGSSNFNLRWTQTLPLIRNTFRIWFAGRYRINLFITRTKGHSFTSTFAVNENDVTFYQSSMVHLFYY